MQFFRREEPACAWTPGMPLRKGVGPRRGTYFERGRRVAGQPGANISPDNINNLWANPQAAKAREAGGASRMGSKTFLQGLLDG